MNMQSFKNLNIYQRVKLVTAVLAGLLVLLLIVGSLWAATLPPAPVLKPSPESLQVSAVVLSAVDAETHYLDGLMPIVTDAGESRAVDEAAGERSIMASRPLFWADRRPVVFDASQMEVTEEQGNPARANELDSVELSGVYFAGDASGVIVRIDGQRRRVALGEDLLGWKLKSVDGAEVRFVSDGQEKSIQLEHARGGDYTPATSRKTPASANEPASDRAQQQ